MDQRQRPVIKDTILDTLIACCGYYNTPKDENGVRQGPLVGYAGTYDDGDGPKHYVGEIFYNFAMMEQYPTIMGYYAYELIGDLVRYLTQIDKLEAINEYPVFVGAPMGGISVARDLALALHKRFCVYGQPPSNARAIYPEKKTLEQGVDGQRAKTQLAFDRHTICKGDSAFICEDVVNNLTTTEKGAEIIETPGAELIAILCEFNRSEKTFYKLPNGREVPILSVMHQPTAQYRQDDPYVAADVAAGKVIWKPKDCWAEVQRIYAEFNKPEPEAENTVAES